MPRRVHPQLTWQLAYSVFLRAQVSVHCTEQNCVQAIVAAAAAPSAAWPCTVPSAVGADAVSNESTESLPRSSLILRMGFPHLMSGNGGAAKPSCGASYGA